MKNYFLLFIALIGFSFSGFGQINIYTNVTWSNTGIGSDVIIHPGATLTIQNGGVQMTAGNSITIMDGGALVGINGYIFSSFAKWEGIIVEQTPTATPSTNFALNLNNFNISNAENAIESGYDYTYPYGYHNRRMIIYNTEFEGNTNHLRISNTLSSTSLPLAQIESQLSAMTYALISVSNCTFGDASSSTWPIHLVNTNGIRFLNSDFTDNTGSQTALHFMKPYKPLIRNCVFNGTQEHYISSHGYSMQAIYTRNTFNLSDNGALRTAIESGFINGCGYEGIVISDNTFYSDEYNGNAWAIASGTSSSTFFNGSTISGNTFTNLKYGIRERGFNSDNLISKNTFDECNTAMYFFEENPVVDIECNTFIGSYTDIHIANASNLQNQSLTWVDPGNTFSNVSSGGYNIVNDGPTMFIYNWSTTQPVIPPGSTNISLPATFSVVNCSEGGGDVRKNNSREIGSIESETKSIEQYPNPANDIFYFDLNGQDVEFITITNIDGQVVSETNVSDKEDGRIFVQELLPGIYFCTYTSNGQLVDRQKMMIVH